jgi:hypothetical protein
MALQLALFIPYELVVFLECQCSNLQIQHPKILSLLHIAPFCEGPNEKLEGFAKQKQKT